MIQETLKTQYPFNNGMMYLKVGQTLKAGNTEFMISHIRISHEPGLYITKIFIRPITGTLTALWKEIINGAHVNSFNVDFLCKE